MLANRPALGEFKENIKVSSSTKQNSSMTRKGLKSRSLNSFVDGSQNVNKTKKILSESNANECKRLQEKENSKPIIKSVKEEKASDIQDDWSDIEEMHIYNEPDDDYEDILPKCDRIQKADIDSLFISFTYTNFTDLDEYLPSPYPEVISYEFPECPANPPTPDFTGSLYDDSPLEEIPLIW